jgi:hypothetical protein
MNIAWKKIAIKHIYERTRSEREILLAHKSQAKAGVVESEDYGIQK